VQYVEEGLRYRIRVRHTVGNPFEFYFPPIDYEWEYIMVADGGISARGLHDGAPKYEIFYEHPHTDTRVRTYTFSLDVSPALCGVGGGSQGKPSRPGTMRADEVRRSKRKGSPCG
jgi:hypothetical protein